MKKLLILISLLLTGAVYAQTNNTTNTNFTNGLASSKFLNIPNGALNPTTGLLSGSLFFKTGTGLQYWNGTAWQTVAIAGGGVTSFNGRNGAVLPQTGDYSAFYPLLNGTGATGTWGINTTGSAGSLTTSLTPGYGLSGTAFNGSTARTFLVDTAAGIASKTYVQNYTWTKAQADARFAPLGGASDLQAVTTAGATTTNAMTVNTSPGASTNSDGITLSNVGASGLRWSPSLTWAGIGSGGSNVNWSSYITTGAGVQASLNFDYFNSVSTSRKFSIGQTGVFQFYNAASTFNVGLNSAAITANRTIGFPDVNGTLALTSDVSALNLQSVTSVGASSTNTISINKNPGTGTYSEALTLENTDLTTGAQWSPSVYWKGTRSGATSMGFQAYFQPTTVGAGNMRFDFFNGTTRLNMFSISSLGNFQLYNGSGFAGIFSPASITANRSYTLPDAGGTFALTSNLTSLVPYTGATSYLDLGNQYLKTHDITVSDTGTPTKNTQIGDIGISIANTVNEQLIVRSVNGEIAYNNATSGGTTSLTFESPTTLNSILIPNKAGTLALTSDFEADSYLLSMLDPGDNPVTFTDGGGLYRLHYMRIQNQVTLDVDVAQLTTSWLANDNFSFRINLPIISNFSDYEDLSGNMVIKSQQNAGVNVINFLTVEPDLSPAPYAVISGQYNLPGADSLLYHIHLMYTVKP